MKIKKSSKSLVFLCISVEHLDFRPIADLEQERAEGAEWSLNFEKWSSPGSMPIFSSLRTTIALRPAPMGVDSSARLAALRSCGGSNKSFCTIVTGRLLMRSSSSPIACAMAVM